MIIKKVRGSKSGQGYTTGHIYLPKNYVGEYVRIEMLSKTEKKSWLKELKQLEKEKEQAEKKLEKHLQKLKELRGEIKRRM